MATPPNELEARKRNIERRRETSRFAARDRRGKEADIFTDLKEVVPVVNEATVTHVDRIALLRVAATLCRLRKTASEVLRNDLADEVLNGPVSEETISEAFDGFVVLADGDGSIVYVTESVALYLGLTQTDLTGRNLKEFMHPTDYDEFVRMQGEMSGNAARKPDPCSTILRLKTVISPRGRNLNLKSALYKPISFLIQMRRSHSNVVMVMQGCSIPAGVGSINATANAITKGAEAPNGAFMTRHTCDMKISYVSDAFTYILKGPNPKTENRTLMGSSFYELVHPSDAHIVHKSMRELFAKGHTRTPYYRLIASNRTLAWVMTEATTINHTTRGQKGQYVICVHFVLGIQGESESLVVCTDEIPAGIPVLKKIKAEIMDQMEVDVLPPQQVHVADPLRGRQPDVMECVDFTPLIADTNSVGYPNPVAAAGKNRLAALQQEKNEPRKSSYDAVLQWLFRDQPSSPAPQYNGDEGRCEDPRHIPSRRASLAAGTCYRAGAEPQSAGARVLKEEIEEGQPGQHQQYNRVGRGADSAYQYTGRCGQSARGVGFPPPTDGMAKCELRSPAAATAAAPTHFGAQNQSDRPRDPSVRVCTAADMSRGVPSIPPADPFPLCPIGAGDARRGPADSSPMYSTMSTANSANAATSINPYNAPSQQVAPSGADSVLLSSVSERATTALADLDFPFDDPDLTGLAPFVPQEELRPMCTDLPKELQALFAEVPDWIPSDFAPAAFRVPEDMEKQLAVDCADMKNGPFTYQPGTPQPYVPRHPVEMNMAQQTANGYGMGANCRGGGGYSSGYEWSGMPTKQNGSLPSTPGNNASQMPCNGQPWPAQKFPVCPPPTPSDRQDMLIL